MEDRDGIAIAIGSAIAGVAVAVGWFINIPIAGTIIGVLAGFFLSTYTTTRTQRRAWKRDFMLRAVELVYGPLYNQAISIEERYGDMSESRNFQTYPNEQWSTISRTYIYYMLDENLRKDIVEFYKKILEYNELTNVATRNVERIAIRRSSEVFGSHAISITYTIRTPTAEAGVGYNVNDLLLLEIHPLQYYPNAQRLRFSIRVREQSGSETYYSYDSEDDFRRFEEFWRLASADVANDTDIQRMKKLFHEIPVLNKKVMEKLVGKIQEPSKI